MRIRPRRFQGGGVNDPTWTPTAGGSAMPDGGTMTTGGTAGTTPSAGGSQQPGDGTQTTAPASTAPASTAPSSTSTAPSGSSVNYFSLTPAQQQAYANGDPNYMQAGQAAPAAPAGGAGANFNYNPYVSPSQNPAPPAGYVAEPFGTGTSVVPSGATAFQNFLALQNSPFMTPAAIQNQSIVGNAGLPASLQGNATVPVGNQQVPWASMTPAQQYMYEYLEGTGQSIPSDFMSAYQGPSAAWNSPALNNLGVPAGSQIVNGALVNSSGNFTFPGSSAGPKAGAAPSAAPASGGGIANPGAFTSAAPGAGVGTGMGAAGTPASPQAQTPPTFMGQNAGLGFRRGGAITAEGRAPMRMRGGVRPRKFQAGGVNPTDTVGQLAALMQSRGAVPTPVSTGGGGPGAAQAQAIQNSGLSPQAFSQWLQQQGGMPLPGMGGGMGPGAAPSSAGMGAMAGALPGGPGAAAMGAMAGAANPLLGPAGSAGSRAAGMGAMAGASPGTPGAAAMGAAAGAMPGTLQQMPAGAGGMAAPGMGAAQSPNQQWAQLLLGGAPGTGLNQQTLANNPTAQQALYRAYLGQLGRGGFAHGGEVHADHPSASHPDPQWGLVAETADRKADGGPIQKFDSTKGAPENLPTHPKRFAKGGSGRVQKFDSTKGAPENLPTHPKAFAKGGKSVLHRKPKKDALPPPAVEHEAPPTQPPPFGAAGGAPPAPAPAPAPPAGPPAGAAPFAKGGEVCDKCGKAHGGECKGMRRGGKFHGAKAKKPKMAEGGKWIQGAIKHPGALHKQLGVPQGEKIPAGKLAKAAKSSGKLGQRARLAQTLKGLKKAGGGAMKLAQGGAGKQRKGYPNTNPPPKKMRFASGGKMRGAGAAVRGTNFSGIY